MESKTVRSVYRLWAEELVAETPPAGVRLLHTFHPGDCRASAG